jgi:hypothetical protein
VFSREFFRLRRIFYSDGKTIERRLPGKKRDDAEGSRFFRKETGQTERVDELSFHVESIRESDVGREPDRDSFHLIRSIDRSPFRR